MPVVKSLTVQNGQVITGTTGGPDASDLPIFVASGSGHAPGAVPDPGATAGTTKYLREDATWDVPGGSGTVTSVALAVPSFLTVSGSPITTSGTLTIALANETANYVLAGPTSGPNAAPTFRALVPADYPAFVASGSSHAGGAVPDPGATAGTTKFLREDATWDVPGGSGTVTSVGLSLPSIFSVSGTPVTTSGTITATLATETAHYVLIGPTSGSAAPTFRALVAADIPAISLTSGVSGLLPVANGGSGTSSPSLVGGTNVTISGSWPNQTVTAAGGGTVTSVGLSLPAIFSVSGTPVTTSGTLTATLATESANLVLAGPSSGSAAAPTFRALANADLPASGVTAGTYGCANVTVNSAGVVTSAVTNLLDHSLCQYRLSLTSGVPVTTADVSSTGSLYWTPYKGNRIGLYYSSAWALYAPGELSLAISGLTGAVPYDIFVSYNGSAVSLSSVAWSTETARVTALSTQDGVLVLSTDSTKRYVGTVNGTGVAPAGGGSSAMYDTVQNRWVWNYYNRIPKSLYVADPANSWNPVSYNAWEIADNNPDNKFSLVCGVVEDDMYIYVQAICNSNSGSNPGAFVGFSLNPGTPPAPYTTGVMGIQGSALGEAIPVSATFTGPTFLGSNFFAWIEYASSSTGTTTWYGSDSGIGFRYSGMIGTYRC